MGGVHFSTSKARQHRGSKARAGTFIAHFWEILFRQWEVRFKNRFKERPSEVVEEGTNKRDDSSSSFVGQGRDHKICSESRVALYFDAHPGNIFSYFPYTSTISF